MVGLWIEIRDLVRSVARGVVVEGKEVVRSVDGVGMGGGGVVRSVVGGAVDGEVVVVVLAGRERECRNVRRAVGMRIGVQS